MKMMSVLLLFVATVTILVSCSQVDIKGTSVNLKYTSSDETQYDIHLDDEEAAKIKEIFDGKKIYKDAPSCSFNDLCGFNIGGEMYAIALDGCGVVKHCPTGKYFYLSEQENEYLHSLFEAYEIEV